MSNIQLVAIDVDGTLLAGKESLSPRSRQAIDAAREQDVAIAIATNRNYSFAQQLCSDLGLDVPMICANGASVYAGPLGPRWRHSTIPQMVASQIYGLADQYGWYMSINIHEFEYLTQQPDQSIEHVSDYTKTVQRHQRVVGTPHMIVVRDSDAIELLDDMCRKDLAQFCRFERFYGAEGQVQSAGIFSKNADKGSALAHVAERLHVAPQNIMVIGDSSCDLSMLKYARFGVALENTQAPLEADAQIIAPTLEHEGVAWALEQYVLA